MKVYFGLGRIGSNLPGDKSRTASKESLPVESLATQESEPALAPRPSASKTQSKKSWFLDEALGFDSKVLFVFR